MRKDSMSLAGRPMPPYIVRRARVTRSFIFISYPLDRTRTVADTDPMHV
jgi:hypothetical protein